MELPKARVHRSKAGWLIWLVPLLAAGGAGYYFYQIYQQRGPELTVSFRDGTGLRVGDTPLTVHGVKIGTLQQVDLGSDNESAVLHIRLQRNAVAIAKKSSMFWLVRPEISGGNISGLGTVVSGPYIEGIVGDGVDTYAFTGLERQPLMLGDGIRVIVRAQQIEHAQMGTPIFYRGIQVGQVQDIRLGDDSATVNLTLFIWKQYQPLLRSDSVFWSIMATDVKGNIFSGIDVHLGSLRTVLGGGIAFATPDQSNDKDASVPAADGTQYELHDEPKKEWLAWAPKIKLPDAPNNDPANTQGEPAGLRSALRVK